MNDQLWGEFKQIVGASDAIKVSGCSDTVISLPLDGSDDWVCIIECYSSRGFFITDIFSRARDRKNVSPEIARQYLDKLLLLPPPTLPDRMKGRRTRFVRTHKDNYVSYACNEYVWRSSIVYARGEPIRVGKKTFPYILEDYLAAVDQ